MGLAICPHCMQSSEEGDFMEYEGKPVCPSCMMDLRDGELRIEAQELRRFPTAPREVTPAIRKAYMGQNQSERVWLYVMGAVLLAIQPAIHLLSEKYEIEPLRHWGGTSAYIGDLPSVEEIRKRRDAAQTPTDTKCSATVVYYTGYDQIRKRPIKLVSQDDDPGGTEKIAQPRSFSYEEALALWSHAEGKEIVVPLHYSLTEPSMFVGSWEYGGKGRDGKIAAIRNRNWGYTFTASLAALLGWISALIHARRMARKVWIFRNGSLIVSTSNRRIDVFRREFFDHAISFTKLGKAWMILKLHLNVLYLVRTPKHSETLIMQLAPRVAPWTVHGDVVVCYLPSDPNQAVLVPADVGTRLKALL